MCVVIVAPFILDENATNHINCNNLRLGSRYSESSLGSVRRIYIAGDRRNYGADVQSPQPVLSKPASDADPNATIKQYCVGCHNERAKGSYGNLSLDGFDVAAAYQNAETAEKMIRKLRAGMMPPPGAKRPEGDVLLTLVERLEKTIDAATARNPNPGGRSFQRLNRPEYERAIRDLLALNVKAENWLPLDTMSNNFDNMADAQSLSPMLLESYLNAAAAISRLAIGDRTAPSVDETYTNSQYVSQNPWDHIDGARYGTRGGLVVDHVFPVDGQYTFGLTFLGGFGVTPGDRTRLEDIDISIDGERAALLMFDSVEGSTGADGRGSDVLRSERVFVRAGQHKVAAAFVRRSEGPLEDLIRPHDWSFAGGGSGGSGITTLPHLRDLIVSGPYDTTGVSTIQLVERSLPAVRQLRPKKGPRAGNCFQTCNRSVSPDHDAKRYGWIDGLL